jgi:hypothetical protein
MTGQRRHRTLEGTMTGDVNIDAVLSLLTQSAPPFTASTGATFDGTSTPAAVAQDGTPEQRSVTIGAVRFISDATGDRTCVVDTGVCEPALKPAAVSNTGLTPEFAVGDMAKRLRRDAAAKAATPRRPPSRQPGAKPHASTSLSRAASSSTARSRTACSPDSSVAM